MKNVFNIHLENALDESHHSLFWLALKTRIPLVQLQKIKSGQAAPAPDEYQCITAAFPSFSWPD